MAEKRLAGFARSLRNTPTYAEQRLWLHWRASRFEGAKFTRPFPVGGFIVDFACRSLRIAIELDGGQHSESKADTNRTRIIEAHGFRVIRFWNNEVLGNIDGVLQVISEEIATARNDRP